MNVPLSIRCRAKTTPDEVPIQKYARHDGGALSVWVPIRTVSEANCREHWAAKAKRAKLQRQATAYMLNPVERFIPKGRVRVKLVRMSPRLLDDDNLVRSMKAVRDEVAAVLGVDDRDPCVKWEYDQKKHKTPVVWVHIAPQEQP